MIYHYITNSYLYIYYSCLMLILIFRYRFERFDDNIWDDDCRLLLKDDEVIELIWDNGIVCDILLVFSEKSILHW